MARADFHTHTAFSPDALTSPAAFVRRCCDRGLTHVAITDHTGIEGALAVAEIAPFTVIVGQEVKTAEGELIGLFLVESVPSGLPARETAERIHRQGAVVVAPHPFDPFRPNIGRRGLAEIGDAVDIIEGYNGRSMLRRIDRAARRYAAEHDLPVGLGSDAHCRRELGRSFVELPDFDGPEALLVGLRQASYHLARPAPWLVPSSGIARARRWIGGGPAASPRPEGPRA